MNKCKKTLRQLVVAFLLLNTIGLPVQNIVLANELSTTEEVITEEVEINENEMIASEEVEQPTEEITDSKEEVKKSNQPVEVGNAIEKDVKAISSDKISVIFPDAALAEVIRNTLGKSSVDDVVTQAELDTITQVSAQSKGVVDISGVENLTNLTNLDLKYNQISNLSPLENSTTNLTQLNLGYNQISDISPLKNLLNMVGLYLNNNQITDISFLPNMPKVSILHLHNNQISDLSPLMNVNLSNIGRLFLDDNQISDISPLMNLTAPEVSLGNNQISDLSPLVGSKLSSNLVVLNLVNNEISDTSLLMDANMANLIRLYLEGNQISDISPLENWQVKMPRLMTLNMKNQLISLSTVKWNDPLDITNSITNLDGDRITPSSISNQGVYTDPTIAWNGLANASQSVSYNWYEEPVVGGPLIFSGKATMQVNPRVEYDVHFDVDGVVATESVLEDYLVTEPAVPNKVGYAFTGWYDAETGGTKWDFSTNTMPSRNMTLYARFNKLGFVTPEIKPVMPNVVTPIMPGVDPVTPSIEPPSTPGEGPNVVAPSTPGAGGNQTPSNDSGLNTVNTGNTMITSQEDIVTSFLATSQEGKLAKLGENNSLLLQGFGALMVLSGVAFFLVKRRKMHS
ncbi:leucine-rich repeat domain-containing protein [Listeria monocytogenes]|nr:leucine-rich repeat domain-containing protein [Listeria monocytogenes]EJU4184894.1 leucine-rich repeat domain-containing protein [Listeria monocytogenes]EKZ0248212.1 leucine-rich repeat domain-containing protein [Listeria monocytogenes]EMB2358822.1 leucine-rich repeat domain-containing protein [Listeria monocytogenes]